MTGARPSVAIIGAGFSGLILAIHLLRAARGPRIYLIEGSEAFGLGAAYSTVSGRHVLNVRAANMSIFPDRPRHFLDWLEAQPGSFAAGETSFITRRTYGEYLQSLLRDAACGEQAAGRLYLVPDEALAIDPAEGGGYAVSLKVGKVLGVDAAIVATGNAPPLPPAAPEPAFFDSPRYIDDPWSPDAFEGIAPGDSVLMLGTGLTMADVALLLTSRGAKGPLIALSRRGQLPRPHIAPMPAVPAPELPPELSAALGAVRRAVREAEANGGAWQQVMDALRPRISAYWQALPMPAKQRFLRHLRPWWDVHRHRLAPQVAARMELLLRGGELTVRRGRLAGIALEERTGDAPVAVTWRPAFAGETREMRVHHVVNCMGPGGDPTRSRRPLIRHLLGAGLARPDPLRLGLDVDGAGRVIAAGGQPAERLFALGPPTRGVFWESTAVPDIRQYAAQLAETVLGALHRTDISDRSDAQPEA